MESLPWLLYIVLAIVVWQLSGSIHYAPTTATATALSISANGDDRFVAFRFEVPAPDGLAALKGVDDSAAELHPFLKSTATLATNLHCFGWIQQNLQAQKCFVGEARCPRRNAPALMAHLQPSTSLPDDRHAVDAERLLLNEDLPNVFVYTQAKIRFHFPRFRVLSEPKYQGKTCFKTPPHACATDRDSRPSTESSAPSQPRTHNDEL